MPRHKFQTCVSADRGRWRARQRGCNWESDRTGPAGAALTLQPVLLPSACCKMACMSMLLLAASASAPADGQRFWTSRADPVVSAVNRAAQEAAPPSRQEFVNPLADLRATCNCGNVLSRVPPHSVFDQDPSLAHAFRSLPFLEFEWMKVLPFLQNQYE